MSELVLREDKNGVATLTVNRPEKLNALNVGVFEALDAHVQALAAETETTGCVVLRGAGRCFSAGHDLKDIAAGEKPPSPNYQAHVIEDLANLPQPVISAVHSHCYTGALELALAADLILASDNAKFADTHSKWALTPGWGISQRLPQRVGRPKATEMMLTAKTYSATEAEAMGLCNVRFPDETFWEDVQSFAETMLENSWYSLRAYKRLLIETDSMDLQAGLAHEIYHSAGSGPDKAERIAAFGKK